MLDETKITIKAARMQEKVDKTCERITYSNLQEKLEQSRELRNLKLFRSYQKQWANDKKINLLKLSQEFSLDQKIEKEFKEQRLSVMDHVEK